MTKFHDRSSQAQPVFAKPAAGTSGLAAVLLLVGAMPSRGTAQERLFQWQSTGGKSTGFRFPSAGSSVGDVDGDGVPDVVLGAKWDDTTKFGRPDGAVYVFSGSTGLVLRRNGGGPYSKLGAAVDGGHDFDLDGVPDFIAGAPEYADSVLGVVGATFVYSGATGTALYSLLGETVPSLFGSTVASLDDVDGDGVADFAVAASSYKPPTGTWGGRVYVYSGATGASHYIIDGVPGVFNPHYVFALDDINGDGCDDIGVGASLQGTNGEFRVCDGTTGSLLYSLKAEPKGRFFGASACRLGDLDVDGVDDFMVADRGYMAGSGTTTRPNGRVYVYSGASGTLLYLYEGAQDEELGYLPKVGRFDFNHDGVPDFAIGSPFDAYFSFNPGRAFVYSGRHGRLLWEFRGTPIKGYGEALGAVLSAVGDLNQDAIDDLVIGGPDYALPYNSTGRACAFAGNDLFLQASQADYLAGDFAYLDLRGGETGALTLLAIVGVNGSPTFLPLHLGALDGNGEDSIGDWVPAGLTGHTLTFQAWATRSGKGLADSAPETIGFK